MKVVGTTFLVFFMAALATANYTWVKPLTGEEQKPPFASDDPVPQIVSKLTNAIRVEAADVMRAFVDVSQKAILESPIPLLSYRYKEKGGLDYFVVKTKVIDQILLYVRILRNDKGKSWIKDVIGPVSESTPMDFFGIGVAGGA